MQPALQDEPRRSGGASGPSLAEHRPKTAKQFSARLPSSTHEPAHWGSTRNLRTLFPLLVLIFVNLHDIGLRFRAVLELIELIGTWCQPKILPSASTTLALAGLA